MLTTIRNISILVAFVLLGLISYEIKFHDSAHKWINNKEPQMASYTNLDEDEEILKELSEQKKTLFGSYKDMDKKYFVQPTIFNTIQR